jgi:hypothetical protein
MILCLGGSSVIHYTDPKTLETHTTSTKGSVFVLHVELPSSYTCHKDELYGLWQNGEFAGVVVRWVATGCWLNFFSVLQLLHTEQARMPCTVGSNVR